MRLYAAPIIGTPPAPSIQRKHYAAVTCRGRARATIMPGLLVRDVHFSAVSTCWMHRDPPPPLSSATAESCIAWPMSRLKFNTICKLSSSAASLRRTGKKAIKGRPQATVRSRSSSKCKHARRRKRVRFSPTVFVVGVYRMPTVLAISIHALDRRPVVKCVRVSTRPAGLTIVSFLFSGGFPIFLLQHRLFGRRRRSSLM